MGRNELLINVECGETRVALIENGVLAELYLERSNERSTVGNVYLGKVTRVLPGMQAAFIDIGTERAAFLHVEDLIPDDMEKFTEGVDEEKEGNAGKAKRVSRDTPIREVVKEGDDVVVQVNKGPIGTKGARVTGHVTLPGRYVVLLPTVDHVGVSKRIGNDKERRRLREVIDSIRPPKGGIIVRSFAQGLTKKQLKADVGYLAGLWDKIGKKRGEVKRAPALLYDDLDIVLRAARDMLNENVAKIIVDDAEEFRRLRDFLELFMPERVADAELYDGAEPLFDEYGIEEEIIRALSRRVPLPSGGYLVIDQAEALTAIDVNTGRFTGRGQDVEETIVQTNLEAVKEIAYQLRFRNIGGLIVLDFIDMQSQANRNKVYRAFTEMLRHDKAKTTAVRISELGLVEMTRKRTRESLGRTLYEACFYCDGTGHLQSKSTVCHSILRQIRRDRDSLPGYKVLVSAHPAVCDMLEREEKSSLDAAGRKHQRRIVLQPRKDYHLEQFDLSGG